MGSGPALRTQPCTVTGLVVAAAMHAGRPRSTDSSCSVVSAAFAAAAAATAWRVGARPAAPAGLPPPSPSRLVQLRDGPPEGWVTSTAAKTAVAMSASHCARVSWRWRGGG